MSRSRNKLINHWILSLSLVSFFSCVKTDAPNASSDNSGSGGSIAKRKVIKYNIRRDSLGRGVIALTNTDTNLDYASLKGSVSAGDVKNFKLVRGDGSNVYEIDGGLPTVDSYKVKGSRGPYKAVVQLKSGGTKVFNF